MATDSILSKIRHNDFFAIMAPGFLILISFMILLLSIFCKGELSTFTSYWDKVKTDSSLGWTLLLGIVLLCYLIGNIPRSFSVHTSDKLCDRLFHRSASQSRSNFIRRLFNQEFNFPYQKILEMRIDELRKNGLKVNLSLSSLDPHNTVFNYWKLVICNCSPNLFDYIQQFEARVRLFNGMFWSGVCGVVFGLLGLFANGAALVIAVIIKKSWGWHWFIVLCLTILVSAVFVFFFGKRLRFMREDEASHTFMAYILLNHR